jgi:hypothetical protein
VSSGCGRSGRRSTRPCWRSSIRTHGHVVLRSFVIGSIRSRNIASSFSRTDRTRFLAFTGRQRALCPWMIRMFAPFCDSPPSQARWGSGCAMSCWKGHRTRHLGLRNWPNELVGACGGGRSTCTLSACQVAVPPNRDLGHVQPAVAAELFGDPDEPSKASVAGSLSPVGAMTLRPPSSRMLVGAVLARHANLGGLISGAAPVTSRRSPWRSVKSHRQSECSVPKWFSHNLPTIRTPLLVVVTYLHARNLQRSHSRHTRLVIRCDCR